MNMELEVIGFETISQLLVLYVFNKESYFFTKLLCGVERQVCITVVHHMYGFVHTHMLIETKLFMHFL